MRKVAGVLMVVLVLGLAVSSAVSSGAFVSASKAVDSNSVYNAFWDILENESYLVYKLNVTHDLSAAPALVKNSRRGEENAAEISALIWVARNKLKASGVKTYYTADELRAMAENISKNGLPEDTVKSLKEQGWTDDEIKALEDYIRKNADNITSGFDMLEFLKNFSKAFVDVAFKYSSYESWAIWKWKWEGLPDFTDTIPNNVSINPLLAQDWMDLYAAYASNNTTALVKAAGSMSADMYFLVTSMGSYSSKPVTLVFLKDKKIMNYGSSLDDLLFFNNLLVADVEHTNFDFKNPGKFTTYTWHIYWQNPLKAYNLTRQIYSLTFAMENGNDNPELRWILNEKMDELKESLIANITEEVSVTDIKNPPIKIEPPHQPIGMQSRGGSSSSLQVTGTKTSGGYTLTSHTPTEIELEAITPYNEEGRLDVDNISVVVDSKSSNSVSYHIEVMVEAEKNAVSDVEVNLTDDTTGESDSGNLGLIYEGSYASWRSHEFTASVSGDSITIHGRVFITYTPNCGDSPTSTHGKITPATCNEPHTITRSYSKTVHLSDSGGGNDQPSGDLEIESVQIDPNSNIKAGDTVSFNVVVNNSYSSSKQVELELFIDGKEVDSASGSVGADSEGSFMLHWIAQVGEHSYTVKLYSLLGGQKSEEDERGGKVMVASSNQQFAVELEAFPTELEGGGTVYFTIKGWNYAHDALNVQFHVVNESGKVVYPKDGGWISKYLPEGASNYTIDGFSWGVHGVGNHTYTVIARISGEEEKGSVTITVRPVNGTELKQVGFECDDIHFDFRDRAYRASLSCQVYLYDSSSSKMSVKDITVENNYSLGQLGDVTFGSLDVGKWNIIPEEFDIDSQETKTITFSLPLEISSYVPISGSDATEVLAKDGSHTEVTFTYTLGYSIGDGKWYHYSNTVRDYVKITMDAKTVAADYILSGGMAFIDPNTAITFSIGSMRISGIRLSLKLSFDPWAFLWNGWIKPYILEHT